MTDMATDSAMMDSSYYDSIEPNTVASIGGLQDQQTGGQHPGGSQSATKSPSVDLTLDSLDGGDLDADYDPGEEAEAAEVRECDCEGGGALSVRQFVNHRGESMLLHVGGGGAAAAVAASVSPRGSTPTSAGGNAQQQRQRGLSSVRSQRHRLEETTAERRRASLVDRQRRLRDSTVSRDLADLDALGRVSAVSDDQLMYLPGAAGGSTGGIPQLVSRLPGGYTILGPAFEDAHSVPEFSTPVNRALSFNGVTVGGGGSLGNGGSRLDVADAAAPVACPDCTRLRSRVEQLESETASLLEQLRASRAVVEAMTSAAASAVAGASNSAASVRVDQALMAENRMLRRQVEAAAAVGSDLSEVRRQLRAQLAARSASPEAEAAAARGAELTARCELLQRRCADLSERVSDLQLANQQLQLSLGRVRGVLPDLSVDDIELLERRWCDLPMSIGAQLEDGDILADKVRDEEGVNDEHQVVQCLWYRYQVTKRSLGALQLRLESLGVSSANQLDHLKSLTESTMTREAELQRLRDQVAAKEGALRALEGSAAVVSGLSGISMDESLSRVLASLERLEKADYLRPAAPPGDAPAGDSPELKEVRSQLEIYREKLRMMADEKCRLEEALQAASGLEETRRERDGIAANFDRLNRRWQEDKERADRLAAELQSGKEQLHELRAFEFKFQAADEERRSLRDQVKSLTEQLAAYGRDSREQMSGRDEALRAAATERDAARHEAASLRSQLEAERQRHSTELQAVDTQAADMASLKRELDYSRRLAAGQEVEKDRLLDEVKRLGAAAASGEATTRELRERCLQTAERLRREATAPPPTDPQQQQLQLQRARDALEELERVARDAEWKLADAAHTATDLSSKAILMAHSASVAQLPQSHNSGGGANNGLYSALEAARAAGAELRERLRAQERRTDERLGELREALGSAGAHLQAERQRAESTAKEAEALARRLEAATAEATALRSCRDQAEQLRLELRETATRLESAREANAQLQSKCALTQERLENSEAGLQQLRAKCSELVKDNEELEKVSAADGDKAGTLVNIVERLKNRADKLALDNRALASEKQALKESLRQAEADWQLERQSLQAQAAQLKVKADQLKRDLRTKAKEAEEFEGTRRQLERSEAALRQSELAAAASKQRLAELEASAEELKRRLAQLEESEAASRSLMKDIEQLRARLATTEASLKDRDTRAKAREAQLVSQQRQRVSELENLLSQERSQLAAAKAKGATLEDEVDYLRSQLSKAKQHAVNGGGGVGGGGRGGRSHAEQVEQLILRSQTKAQQLLQGNPDLVRSFTPESHLLRASATASPTASFANQLD